jgi:hypothetical protein
MYCAWVKHTRPSTSIDPGEKGVQLVIHSRLNLHRVERHDTLRCLTHQHLCFARRCTSPWGRDDCIFPHAGLVVEANQ